MSEPLGQSFSTKVHTWSSREPGVWEVLLLGSVTLLVLAGVVSMFGTFSDRAHGFGDTGFYVGQAEAIRRWSFGGVHPKALWGFSYLIALVTVVTRLPAWIVLLLLCWASTLIALALAHRLWGGWATAFFAVTSVEWMQHAALGGNETLGAALVFGSLAAARAEHWVLAVLVAVIGGTVRPEGVIATLALGLAMLVTRQYRALALGVLSGTVVLLLYSIPFYFYFGDAFANFNAYRSEDTTGSLITLPFLALVRTATTSSLPWTHQAMVLVWIGITLAGIIAMLSTRRFREHARRAPAETTYVLLLCTFIFTYNSRFAFDAFPRYTMTILPLVYFALQPWLPRDRRLLWLAAFTVPVFAGLSAMNIRRSLAILRARFGA